MSGDKQNQQGGDGSTNIQARNVFISGVSASEAKQIALDTFRSNFTVLSKEAADLALRRAEEITEKFFNKILEEGSVSRERFKQPDIQIALLEAQRYYAQSGDEAVEGILVNLLTDLSKTDNRTFFLTATEDALKTIPRLTSNQANILTLNLLIKEQYFIASSSDRLVDYVRAISEFIVTVSFDSPDLAHLEAVGCFLTDESRYGGLVHVLRDAYPGLFCLGFTREDLEGAGICKYNLPVEPCKNRSDRFQFVGTTMAEVINETVGNNIPQDDRLKILNFMKLNAMSPDDIQNNLLSIAPQIAPIFELEFSSVLQKKITPVGAIIARANFSRKMGRPISLPYRMRDMYAR